MNGRRATRRTSPNTMQWLEELPRAGAATLHSWPATARNAMVGLGGTHRRGWHGDCKG
jgi:hypothetical protein